MTKQFLGKFRHATKIGAHSLLLLSVLLCGACTVTPLEPSIQPPHNPSNHAHRLAQLVHWSAKGKVGIKQNNDGGSAYMEWVQRDHNATITLSGPLGQGTTRIHVSPQATRLHTSKDEVFEADSPEALLYQHTGWRLPISSMKHWIKGLPDPNYPAAAERDEQGLLRSLRQGPWVIAYKNYRTTGTYSLPTKLKISTQSTHQLADLRITVVVKQWNL